MKNRKIMKKLWKIGLCMTLALSLCAFHSKVINAETNSLELSFTESNGRLQLTAITNDSEKVISEINTIFVNEKTANEKTYSFIMEEYDNGVYKGYVDNTYLQKGTYNLKSVSFVNIDGSEGLKMKSACTLDTHSNNECSGYSTLLDGKWGNLKIEGKANYQYPEITSIKGSGFEKNIDVNNHEFHINYELNVLKDDFTTLSLVYDSDKSSEKGVLVLNWNKEQTSVYAAANTRFKGENFTLAFIQVNTYQDGLNVSSVYSDLSEEELLNYYNYNNNGEIHALSNLIGEQNFNFSVTNYEEDVTPPELLSANWKENEVELPGLARFEFEIKDESSGYASIELLTSEYLISNGGEVFDGKGYYDFIFTRYRELDPVDVYGFLIKDNAGNSIYYLCNMEAYDKDTNSYYNYYLNPDIPIKEWKKPIKQLSFTRMQKYNAILNNDSDVAKTLANVNENTLYVIDTYENTKIDKSVFEAVKGKDITLIFENVTSNDVFSTGIQWIINGKDVTNPKTIDTKIDIQLKNDKTIGDEYGFAGVNKDWALAEKNKFVEEMLSSQPALAYYAEYINQFDVNKDDFMTLFWNEFNKNQLVEFNFAKNGELPAKTTIRFKTGYSLRYQLPEKNLLVFYVNNGLSELIADHVDEEKDEFYSFDITHNSQYVLTPMNLNGTEGEEDVPSENDPVENVPNQDPVKNHDKDKNGVNTGDITTSTTFMWLGLSVVSALLMGSVIMRKKKLIK